MESNKAFCFFLQTGCPYGAREVLQRELQYESDAVEFCSYLVLARVRD